MRQTVYKSYKTHKLLSACEYDYLSKFVVLVQYAAPLVCMEARKRARLSQKELERIAGQLMNVEYGHNQT